MKQPTRKILTTMIAGALFCTANIASAAIYMKIDGVPGDVQGPDGARDWFIADSFSFGVEREMKESGEKGGTEDINIGVGELQECTISKSMDSASGHLAQYAINGNSPGQGTVCFSSGIDASGAPNCYLVYKLDRAFVKSWSTSGDADDRPTEEVAFYYNKIAFAYQVLSETGELNRGTMSWEERKQREWTDGLDDIFDIISGTPEPRPPE
ncbi:MAG TPA: type VI secretion system tube protein Hcp [Xanthomonadales bacterium]|nr:type VI secretion system tube protein Hcp [Xanthomonadales bacterium]